MKQTGCLMDINGLKAEKPFEGKHSKDFDPLSATVVGAPVWVCRQWGCRVLLCPHVSLNQVQMTLRGCQTRSLIYPLHSSLSSSPGS